jgi:hypothetical protein
MQGLYFFAYNNIILFYNHTQYSISIIELLSLQYTQHHFYNYTVFGYTRNGTCVFHLYSSFGILSTMNYTYKVIALFLALLLKEHYQPNYCNCYSHKIMSRSIPPTSLKFHYLLNVQLYFRERFALMLRLNANNSSHLSTIQLYL